MTQISIKNVTGTQLRDIINFHKQQKGFTIAEFCRKAGITRMAYYKWKGCKPSPESIIKVQSALRHWNVEIKVVV